MDSLFKLVKGNQVPNLDGIVEAYNIVKNENSYVITINVSAERIEMVFECLCKLVRNPAFLLLEHGTNANVEKELRQSDTAPFHKDVYYLDGLNFETFSSTYHKYKELLIHDGEINFGFGAHYGTDEVFVGPYKIFTIFTDEPEKYVSALVWLNFPKVDRIKTVWDNFTSDTPGGRMTITNNGINIYDMVELLKKDGLYLAERRED